MISAALLLVGQGCSKNNDEEPGVAEYLTGAQHLKTYKKARTQLEDIGKAADERNAVIE
jgi:NADH dehydrogenase FAD-containing subunit